MKCDKCGAEISDGGKSCPNCGAEMPAAPKAQKRKKLWVLFSGLAVIMIAALYVIAVLCIVSSSFLVIAISLLLFAVVLTVCLKVLRKKRKRDTQEVSA